MNTSFPRLTLISPDNCEISSQHIRLSNLRNITLSNLRNTRAQHTTPTDNYNILNMRAMYHARSIIENICFSSLSEKWLITDQVYKKNAVIYQLSNEF
jgi:hypothetical protein